jgi:hypothetical protein
LKLLGHLRSVSPRWGSSGNTRRIADLAQLFASYLVEKYADAARERPNVRGRLPIRQLHQWKITSANDWPSRSAQRCATEQQIKRAVERLPRIAAACSKFSGGPC